MVTEEPRVAMRGRYSTTQTYRLLGISYNSLMKYMNNGLIVANEGKMGRWFYGENIINFWRNR